MNQFEYCSQNRGFQTLEEIGEPYLISSCIWFNVYRIYHGFCDEEYVVWKWRRIFAYREKKLRRLKFHTLLKKFHRHIKGSRRADN